MHSTPAINYCVSLLGCLILAGVLIFASEVFARRFARRVTRIYRFGDSVRFPPTRFTWAPFSLRAMLLSMSYVAVVVGMSSHGESGRTIAMLTGILVGATIAALDFAPLGRSRFDHKPMLGVIGGLGGALMTWSLPTLVAYASIDTEILDYLLGTEGQSLARWIALGLVCGCLTGIVADGYRYHRFRMVEVAPANAIPRLRNDLKPCRAGRTLAMSLFAITGSVGLHVLAGWNLQSIEEADWFGTRRSMQRTLTLSCELNNTAPPNQDYRELQGCLADAQFTPILDDPERIGVDVQMIDIEPLGNTAGVMSCSFDCEVGQGYVNGKWDVISQSFVYQLMEQSRRRHVTCMPLIFNAPVDHKFAVAQPVMVRFGPKGITEFGGAGFKYVPKNGNRENLEIVEQYSLEADDLQAAEYLFKWIARSIVNKGLTDRTMVIALRRNGYTYRPDGQFLTRFRYHLEGIRVVASASDFTADGDAIHVCVDLEEKVHRDEYRVHCSAFGDHGRIESVWRGRLIREVGLWRTNR